VIQENTKTKGNYSEMVIASKFLEYGFYVSFPFGDNAPYDLIVDNGVKLFKVQCKTAFRQKDNQLEVKFERRVGSKRNKSQSYQDLDIDFICAYSLEYKKVFLLDLKEFKNVNSVCLRVTPPLNNMKKGINFAEDYLLDKQIRKYII
jgi:hypothetical protein